MRLKLVAWVGDIPAHIVIRPTFRGGEISTHWPPSAAIEPLWDRSVRDHSVSLEVGHDGDELTDRIGWVWWHEPCSLADVPAVLSACLAKLRELDPPDGIDVSTAEMVELLEALAASALAAVEKMGEK